MALVAGMTRSRLVAIRWAIASSLCGRRSSNRSVGCNRCASKAVRFEETAAGSALDWHTAPCDQYVITLSGTLKFTTRDGESFILRPGDVLIATDTTGTGHRWRLIDDQPWRRVYVEIATTPSV